MSAGSSLSSVDDQANPEVQIEWIAWNIEAAGEALRIDRTKLSALVHVGPVPHTKLGSRIPIGRWALKAWLTSECLAGISDYKMPTVRRRQEQPSPIT